MHSKNAQGNQGKSNANRWTHTTHHQARAPSSSAVLWLIVLCSVPVLYLIASLVWLDVTNDAAPVARAQTNGIPRAAAYKTSEAGDVIVVSGQGFVRGERLSIFVIPATAPLDSKPNWPELTQTIADSDGRISVILKRAHFLNSPYAQANIGIKTQAERFRIDTVFDLTKMGPVGPTPSSIGPLPLESSAKVMSDPTRWQLEVFSLTTLTGETVPSQPMQAIACPRESMQPLGGFGSARWTRQLNVDIFFNMVFTLTATGGVRLFIDDDPVPLIDEWHQINKKTTYKAQKHFSKGMHRLRLEYFKTSRKCQIRLEMRTEYPNWRARVYNTENLDGSVMAHVALDSDAVNNPRRVLDPSPDLHVMWDDLGIAEVNTDHFSADINRTLTFKEPGLYQIVLTVGTNDQARLYINNDAIFADWLGNGRHEARYRFEKGVKYATQLQFKDIDGPASVQLVFLKLPDDMSSP